MTASARHQPFVTICAGGKLTVAKEAIILQQSGSARSADGRRQPPFIHRHLVPGVYGTLAAASQVTSSISACARVINAKMWTKVNLAFLLTLMVAWTHNSSNKWKMIRAVWLFLHVISMAVPEGSGGVLWLTRLSINPEAIRYPFLGYLGCSSSNCQAVMSESINAGGLY